MRLLSYPFLILHFFIHVFLPLLVLLLPLRSVFISFVSYSFHSSFLSTPPPLLPPPIIPSLHLFLLAVYFLHYFSFFIYPLLRLSIFPPSPSTHPHLPVPSSSFSTSFISNKRSEILRRLEVMAQLSHEVKCAAAKGIVEAVMKGVSRGGG